MFEVETKNRINYELWNIKRLSTCSYNLLIKLTFYQPDNWSRDALSVLPV